MMLWQVTISPIDSPDDPNFQSVVEGRNYGPKGEVPQSLVAYGESIASEQAQRMKKPMCVRFSSFRPTKVTNSYTRLGDATTMYEVVCYPLMEAAR